MPWRIWVDTGGTFTDALGCSPDGKWVRTKLLSSSTFRLPVAERVSSTVLRIETDLLPDGFLGGFHCLDLHGQPGHEVEWHENNQVGFRTGLPVEFGQPGTVCSFVSREEAPVLAARLLMGIAPPNPLPPVILHMATTRTTNALLTDHGAPTAFFVTAGLEDLLRIENQQRPSLFEPGLAPPPPLPRWMVGIGERLDASGNVLRAPDLEEVRRTARRLLREGAETAAVALLHSHVNPRHEQKVAEVLREEGFGTVSCSADLAPFIRILPRAQTAVVNAYTTPVLQEYLDNIRTTLKEGTIRIMTSAGGLVSEKAFRPVDSLLSGPAGGVVGAGAVARSAGFEEILAFDMGGTSTDVSRPSIPADYQFQHQVGRARLMTPCLRIETVAAGGGSICWFDGQAPRVGPESAGADPGPACYGGGGPLTVTDVNLLLGRMIPETFHLPVDLPAARGRLRELQQEISSALGREIDEVELLEGWLRIADERMGAAIREVSVRQGHDPSTHVLVAFGGAGGQHGCRIAELLEMRCVLHPAQAGVLSAVGLKHASVERFAEKEIREPFHEISPEISTLLDNLKDRALEALRSENVEEPFQTETFAELRLRGQVEALKIAFEDPEQLPERFQTAYQDQFGYQPDPARLELGSLRVVASSAPPPPDPETFEAEVEPDSAQTHRVCFEGRWRDAAVYHREKLQPGAVLHGPALVQDAFATAVLPPGWQAVMGSQGSLRMEVATAKPTASSEQGPAALELFTNRFLNVVEQMGAQLERTAFSTNVKERLDFSCALLDRQGRLVANAPHIPVHLGALGLCVRSLIERLPLQEGDVAVTNHPAFGGSHLPDLTVVTPVHTPGGELLGFLANRAHHAEMGGKVPGSMPPDAVCLEEEGVVLEPMLVVRRGECCFETFQERLTTSSWPSRSPEENLADLQAQIAANQQGRLALLKLAEHFGARQVGDFMDQLYERAAHAIRPVIENACGVKRRARQQLDDGSPLQVEVRGDEGRLIFDFHGTASQHPGNLNATPGIVRSALLYVLRLLLREPLPLNEGMLRDVEIRLPSGLLHPEFPANPAACPAVVGGNVETSQRLVDTLVEAFQHMAAGQGTMNNLVFGNEQGSYYETLGGGGGAGPGFHGISGRQVHMTNTASTDPEILESRFPVRLLRFSLRPGSGGEGGFHGGDGLVRELEFLESCQVAWLTQNRIGVPKGAHGGEDGLSGRQQFLPSNGSPRELPPSGHLEAGPGDRFRMETPGGGGWGGVPKKQ